MKTLKQNKSGFIKKSTLGGVSAGLSIVFAGWALYTGTYAPKQTRTEALSGGTTLSQRASQLVGFSQSTLESMTEKTAAFGNFALDRTNTRDLADKALFQGRGLLTAGSPAVRQTQGVINKNLNSDFDSSIDYSSYAPGAADGGKYGGMSGQGVSAIQAGAVASASGAGGGTMPSASQSGGARAEKAAKEKSEDAAAPDAVAAGEAASARASSERSQLQTSGSRGGGSSSGGGSSAGTSARSSINGGGDYPATRSHGFEDAKINQSQLNADKLRAQGPKNNFSMGRGGGMGGSGIAAAGRSGTSSGQQAFTTVNELAQVHTDSKNSTGYIAGNITKAAKDAEDAFSGGNPGEALEIEGDSTGPASVNQALGKNLLPPNLLKKVDTKTKLIEAEKNDITDMKDTIGNLMMATVITAVVMSIVIMILINNKGPHEPACRLAAYILGGIALAAILAMMIAMAVLKGQLASMTKYHVNPAEGWDGKIWGIGTLCLLMVSLAMVSDILQTKLANLMGGLPALVKTIIGGIIGGMMMTALMSGMKKDKSAPTQKPDKNKKP